MSSYHAWRTRDGKKGEGRGIIGVFDLEAAPAAIPLIGETSLRDFHEDIGYYNDVKGPGTSIKIGDRKYVLVHRDHTLYDTSNRSRWKRAASKVEKIEIYEGKSGPKLRMTYLKSRQTCIVGDPETSRCFVYSM